MSGQNIRWTVDSRYAALFTPAALNDIISRKNVAREEIKRELPGRRVSLLRPAADNLPEVYLKAYSIPFTKFFRAFVSPYGIHEWQVAHELLAKGVRTYSPIALGIEKKLGMYKKAYLVTEAIPDSTTLKEYIEAYGPRGKNNFLHNDRDLIDLFAEFVSGIRRVGILHTDFHWGNILIRTADDGTPCFYLIDLHNVKLKPPLSHREGLSNLALLNAALLGKVPSRVQINFLKAYLKDMVNKRGTFFRIRNDVQNETRRLLLKKWKKQSARCLQENKYFKKIKMDGLHGYARQGCADALIQLMKNPDELFSRMDSVILKDSRTTSSLLLQTDAVREGTYVKRFNIKGPVYICKHLLRSSRARKDWFAANSMAVRDIPTPEPLLFLEQRKMGMTLKNYFVSEMIAGAKTLDEYMEHDFSLCTRVQKRAFIRTIAQHLRTMHDRGIRHGDLKAKNILVQGAGEGRINIFFVDLDAVKVRDRISPQQRCRDIARLNCSFLNTSNVSRTHRFYFLRAYLGKVKQSEIKSAWRQVLSWTDKKLRKSGKALGCR